ncbi:unnamed protein product [Arctia plantaginis]|uniref:Uncharacterized protein n=1 Tax=Arctia plantaginis TaxID=874455 RepID=A0A8S1A9K7_ARCPL|nr:unnamed protein product [Arctia plantaginis]
MRRHVRGVYCHVAHDDHGFLHVVPGGVHGCVLRGGHGDMHRDDRGDTPDGEREHACLRGFDEVLCSETSKRDRDLGRGGDFEQRRLQPRQWR